MTRAVAQARSFLFVPASRPERFAKALASAADGVILDLEDAVPADQKCAARGHLSDQLAGFGQDQLARILVRINAAETPWQADDLRLLSPWTGRGLAGVMVPKSETVAVLDAVAAALGPAATLVPLVESLAGLDAVDLLAATPQVARLAFGHLDFQLDLGMQCQTDEAELASVRFSLVAASRRARLATPVDGVTTDTRDLERVSGDARRARAFGFGGKLCIHPAQVPAVNGAFGSSEAELDWARRVVAQAERHQGAAFSMDGRMVDLPVIRAAQVMLANSAA